MIGYIRTHGAQNTDIIHVFCGVGEYFTDRQTALAVLRKLVGGGKSCPGLALGSQVAHRQHLPGIFGKQRFWIKGVHVRGTPIHKKMDQPFGTGPEMGRLGQKRIM